MVFTLTDDSVWLVIPAYNVAPWLDTLLSQTMCYIPVQQTLVVDDGSSDATSQVANARGVKVIHLPVNRGKGVALQTGFDYIMEKGGKWVITMDGDCQHDPALIPEFLDRRSGEEDIIIGSRRRGGKMPLDRRLSNGLSSLLLSTVTGKRMEDVQCGYRMIRVEKVRGLIFSTSRYDFEAELLLKMMRNGSKVGWVRIPTNYNGAASSIHRFGDTIRFLKVVWRHLIS